VGANHLFDSPRPRRKVERHQDRPILESYAADFRKGDGNLVTLELVYEAKIDSTKVGTGFSHIVVQVDKLESTLADLAEKGLASDEPQRPAGNNGPKTCFVRFVRVGRGGKRSPHPGLRLALVRAQSRT